MKAGGRGTCAVGVSSSVFLSDDGMVASTDPVWLHNAFDTLMELFGRVDLRKNFRKTVGMMCHPCQTVRVQADEACTRRMTGEGRSYQERQRERLQSPECGKVVTVH